MTKPLVVSEPQHPVQLEILRALLFAPSLSFSKLNTVGLGSDHFTFHLQRLVETGYIQKNTTGYSLTPIGKEFANRMDTFTATVEKQAKLAAKPVVVKQEHGKTLYLAQQRLKQPYFGLWGFPGGKVKWGETVQAAAQRELQEETGITTDTHSLLEDKFFYVFRVENPTGTFIETQEGHRNAWLTKQELYALPIFAGVTEIIDIVESSSPLRFIEHDYFYDPSQY